MNVPAIQGLLNTKSFEPFEFILSSGDRVPVRHPEMVILTKERMFVALPPRNPRELPDDYVSISYLHIAAARPIRNGSRQNRSKSKR